MYLIGYDLGSSSVKAALVDSKTENVISVVQYPDTELPIISHQSGWAEQQPDDWWYYIKKATERLQNISEIDMDEISGIGIGYQMHGLVMVDENQRSIRPSIIWCDSRAVHYGDQAFEEIGHKKCLDHLLNSPGNFTASKIKWIKENEPETYSRIFKIMLPGDYIGMKMTGNIYTTISGLSEGMLWDYKAREPAAFLMDHYGIDKSFIPEIKDSIDDHGSLTSEAADYLGLKEGTPLTYRAGDQPNNAMALNVLNPGEVAATGGTSGVVYAVVNQPIVDPETKINSFAHINYSRENQDLGILLCVNGAGIQYGWLRHILGDQDVSYDNIERNAAEIPVGSNGLLVLPFGNGAERMFVNKKIGSRILNIDFNIHTKSHIYRATLEGIAYAFVYGIEEMKKMGVTIDVLKVGNDNLFQSEIFSTTIASILGCKIEMMNTTGAVGAAKAAGIKSGAYPSLEKAFLNLELVRVFEPDENIVAYQSAYNEWLKELELVIV